MKSSSGDELREILQTLAVKNITREHPTLVGAELDAIKQIFANERQKLLDEIEAEVELIKPKHEGYLVNVSDIKAIITKHRRS